MRSALAWWRESSQGCHSGHSSISLYYTVSHMPAKEELRGRSLAEFQMWNFHHPLRWVTLLALSMMVLKECWHPGSSPEPFVSRILLRLHHLGVIDLIIVNSIELNLHLPFSPWSYVELCSLKSVVGLLYVQPPTLSLLVSISYQVWSIRPSVSYLVRKNYQVWGEGYHK